MEGFKFKTVVMGTSDTLKAEFISLISQRSWSIDGVSGHVFEHKKVAMDVWFPKENASSKVLVSFSYKDVNGVIAVLGRRAKKTLNRFKNRIRRTVGNVPIVGLVLRKNMPNEEKALKSLHAMKLLCKKMREIALESEPKTPILSHKAPPKGIAGKPVYPVDECGFVTSTAEAGIPLFTESGNAPSFK
ncbi:MAG: hypothetical protein ACTSQQ_10275, partial [Candidatus Helarchaeota archaeon]